jgi:hypothetical protein
MQTPSFVLGADFGWTWRCQEETRVLALSIHCLASYRQDYYCCPPRWRGWGSRRRVFDVDALRTEGRAGRERVVRGRMVVVRILLFSGACWEGHCTYLWTSATTSAVGAPLSVGRVGGCIQSMSRGEFVVSWVYVCGQSPSSPLSHDVFARHTIRMQPRMMLPPARAS